MKLPHDHHFIPAFFLQQWVGPSGKLIEYSIKHHKLIAKAVGPRATGYAFDLYAFPELPGEQSQFIEQKFFDYTDRMASDALELLLADAPPEAWTVEVRSAWSRFVVALHLRHPDAMPELRAAAQSVWEGSGVASQEQYEIIRKPEDPPTFDEWLATHDPLAGVKMRVNLIVKTFDNDILGTHMNNMLWTVLDLSKAENSFLMSDRIVVFYNLRQGDGYVSLPISPTKLFVAANDPATFEVFRGMKQTEIARNGNKYAVSRARKYVWAQDEKQTRFIRNNMSTRIEPIPLFPGIGWKG
jgi:hypothetical protein